ncbi:MAG: BON domain-containing protein [Polyangiaceae bacterium]|jgi:osmotically-inducible protein OsmY
MIKTDMKLKPGPEIFLRHPTRNRDPLPPVSTTMFASITTGARASVVQVKEKIESALERQAKTDTNSIQIVVSGGKVTLTGTASSWQTIEDAANAAWAAPGVTDVIDQVKLAMTF